MAKNGTNGRHGKRKTPEEKARLITDATRLLKAKGRNFTVVQVAAKLAVKPSWIYYNVGCAKALRAA